MPGPMDAMAMMGGGGGAPGGPGAMMGGGSPMGDPMGDDALAALSQINPKPANPTQAVQKVEEALDLCHKLVMSCFPQVSQWNPKAAKDLHTIGRQILATKMELKKETPPQPAPSMGMGQGMMGLEPGGMPYGGSGGSLGQTTTGSA